MEMITVITQAYSDQIPIPLGLREVTSTIYVSKTTPDKYEALPHVLLTNRNTGDPHNSDLGKEEMHYLIPMVNLKHQGTENRDSLLNQ